VDNDGEDPVRHPLATAAGLENLTHPTEWVARLYVGSGKSYEVHVPSLEEAVATLSSFATSSEWEQRLVRFLGDMEATLGRSVPDATTLQGAWVGTVKDENLGPRALLRQLGGLVDTHFPPGGPGAKGLPRIGRLPNGPSRRLSVRTAAHLVAATYACLLANRGVGWMRVNGERLHWPEDWPDVDLRLLDRLGSDLPSPLHLFKEQVSRVVDLVPGQAE
jgi:hypothetical protein